MAQPFARLVTSSQSSPVPPGGRAQPRARPPRPPPCRVPVLPQCHVVGGPWFGSDFCPFVCLFVLFGGSRSGLLTCCRIETPTGLVAPALVGETCLAPRGPRAARAALSFRPPGWLCALSVSRPRACSGQLLSPQLGAWRRRPSPGHEDSRGREGSCTSLLWARAFVSQASARWAVSGSRPVAA